MNLLYISYDGAMDPLGKSQVLPYLKGLSGKGFRINLLSFEKKNNLRAKEKIKEASVKLSVHKIEWRYLVYHKNPAIPATLYDIFRGFIAARRILKNKMAHAVHARGYISSIIALALKRLYKIKFIFDMRGLWPDEKVDAGSWKRNSLTYKMMKLLEREFFRRADWIVVLSEEGKLLLEKSFDINGNISVIPTCTDLNLFNFTHKRDLVSRGSGSKMRFVFVYLGSLGSWYMLNEMVDFFKESRHYFDDPLFLFLTNTSTEFITSTLSAKGIAASDYMIRSTDYHKVSRWLSGADASVFFIKPVASKIVSCPTKFGESLACGVPVIINSGIGDTSEIVRREDVGAVIDEFSNTEYARAIDWLRNKLNNRDILRERCRAVAKKYFSLDRGVEIYSKIYNGLG